MRRDVVFGRHVVEHAGQRVLLAPDLDIAVGLGPDRPPIGLAGDPQHILEGVIAARLAHPPRVVDQPAEGHAVVEPQLDQAGLDLGIALLGLLDDAVGRGLIEDLADRRRL
jgi:hypothetical protein